MASIIDRKKYRLEIASDIIRDGLGLELWDKKKNKVLLEIFRNDAKKKIEFFAENVNLPMEIIEELIEIFDQDIGREFQE